MRYAIGFPIAGPLGGDPRSVAEPARIAEQAGWDAVLLEDNLVHHIAPGRIAVSDPWIALAAAAVKTTRIKLGLTVVALPRRRPWKVAREAVSLDYLSGGRMILGVGIGDINDHGFARVGEETDAKARGAMLDEALEVITGLWSGQPFSYQGRFYKIKDLTFLPVPLQQPRIPIWIGGAWPHQAPVRRAARWDGLAVYRVHPDGSSGPVSADEVRAIAAILQSSRSSNEPFDLVAGGYARSIDPGKARDLVRQAAEAGATWWNEYATGGPPRFGRRLNRARSGID
jgi:alkanesulfonate monooxygenase SsuD/methylene tetrahydromethanopterin reductase-like flavin-dependent oxidoreductase (luciferase family)